MPSASSPSHATDIEVVAKELAVDPSRGLNSTEVTQRLAAYGLNTLQTIRSRPAWRVLVDQFASSKIALLAVAAVIGAFRDSGQNS
jgi:magnesium-transporting ATPase (P-type)